MRLATPLRFLLLVGVVPAVVRAQAPARTALVQQVFAAESAFAHTMVARDSQAFAKFVATDAVFFGGRGVQHGRAAVAASWQRFFEGATPPFSWAPEQVEVLEAGNLALSTGPVRDTSGKQTGTFSSIWRLDPDGRWRVVFDKGCQVCNCGKAP